jgi:hypothetical protein
MNAGQLVVFDTIKLEVVANLDGHPILRVMKPTSLP